MIYPKIFEDCMVIVWDDNHEGGGKLVNSPSDKGGLTRWGISQRSHPNEDIINLTQERAKSIFFNEYWTPMKLTLLNDNELILNVFDHGITSGPRTAIKVLQKLVKTTEDGFIGQITVGAVADFEGDVSEEYRKYRKLFYIIVVQKDESQRPNLKGWLRRVDNTHF